MLTTGLLPQSPEPCLYPKLDQSSPRKPTTPLTKKKINKVSCSYNASINKEAN
jgi:hypothetical protein